MPVTDFYMNFRMAGMAKRHQIAFYTLAALRHGHDVMYLVHRCQSSFLLAHLTQRVLFNISVADALPATSVCFIDFRVTFVFVIADDGFLLMFWTVQFIRQIGTAGVLTWSFGLVWHIFTSLRVQQKPPQDFSRDGFRCFILFC